METIKFSVAGKGIAILSETLLVEGNFGEYNCHFEMTEEWKSLRSVSAIFRRFGSDVPLEKPIDSNGFCEIPFEVLKAPYLFVSVAGGNQKLTVETVLPVAKAVDLSKIRPGGGASPDVPPRVPQYTYPLNISLDADQKATAAVTVSSGGQEVAKIDRTGAASFLDVTLSTLKEKGVTDGKVSTAYAKLLEMLNELNSKDYREQILAALTASANIQGCPEAINDWTPGRAYFCYGNSMNANHVIYGHSDDGMSLASTFNESVFAARNSMNILCNNLPFGKSSIVSVSLSQFQTKVTIVDFKTAQTTPLYYRYFDAEKANKDIEACKKALNIK